MTNVVAPHVGVWIETLNIDNVRAAVKSLPTWECGLKLVTFYFLQILIQSLPTWECGLKQQTRRELADVKGVAPHVGVWIETRS